MNKHVITQADKQWLEEELYIYKQNTTLGRSCTMLHGTIFLESQASTIKDLMYTPAPPHVAVTNTTFLLCSPPFKFSWKKNELEKWRPSLIGS